MLWAILQLQASRDGPGFKCTQCLGPGELVLGAARPWAEAGPPAADCGPLLRAGRGPEGGPVGSGLSSQ